MEAASENTTDQEDQTKGRDSGGERELTKGTGKPYLSHSLYRGPGRSGAGQPLQFIALLLIE